MTAALTLSLGVLVLLFVVWVASRLQDHPPAQATADTSTDATPSTPSADTSTDATPSTPSAETSDAPALPLQVFRVHVDVWAALDPATLATLGTWGPWVIWDAHAESPAHAIGSDAWASIATALQVGRVAHHALPLEALDPAPRASGLYQRAPTAGRRSA